jgi:two-component system NtrC family sensor kinase
LFTPEGASTPIEVRAGERVLLANAIPTGEPGAAILLFEDQTEKRRLQEQLLQSEKMSAIGQLIAGVAHDLNNPLASVVGFSDLLAEAADVPPRLAEPLAVIRQEAERASAIVRNLLSFARRQEGERHLQSIRPILDSTHQLLKNQLMAARIELTLSFEPGLPEVEVHANQIKQVFVNIINNAAQAIASTRGKTGIGGGRIDIITRCEPDGLSVNISDNGPGIAEAVAQHVFEPFFSTKSEGEGTGLGLSISQGIVKEHGGNITVDPGGPATGRGATFSVELPTGTHADLSPSPATLVPAPAERVEHLRVLVVDDEPHILHYMQATLESWGHEVVLARDGSQALKIALMQPFDLIICDLRMPRLGGREMFQTLARMHPAVADRIIFATGDTVRGDTLRFLEELGRPFLQKPFKLDALRRVLAGVEKAGVRGEGLGRCESFKSTQVENGAAARIRCGCFAESSSARQSSSKSSSPSRTVSSRAARRPRVSPSSARRGRSASIPAPGGTCDAPSRRSSPTSFTFTTVTPSPLPLPSPSVARSSRHVVSISMSGASAHGGGRIGSSPSLKR